MTLSDRSDPLAKKSPNLAGICADTVIIIGFLVMVGWLFNLDLLIRLLPAFHSMKFNTALGLLLSGAALKWHSQHNLGVILGATVAFAGGLTLLEYVMATDLGIDQLFIKDSAPVSVFPGRMSQVTAWCFVLTGSALILLNTPSYLGARLAEALTVSVSVLGLITLVGYLLSAEKLYRVPGFSSIALHTGLAFLFLGIGILYLIPQSILALYTTTRKSHHGIWYGFLTLTLLILAIGIVAVNELSETEFIANYAIERRSEITAITALLYSLLVISLIIAVLVYGEMLRVILKSQASLQTQKNELERLLATMPSAVYACDAEGRLTFYNARAEEIWGRRPKLFEKEERFCGAVRLYQPDGKRLSPDQSWMARAARTGVSCRNAEVIVEQPDGQRRHISVNIDPIVENGVIVGAINCFNDITLLKDSERQSLAQAETITRQYEELDWIYTHAPMGLCFLDLELRFRRINHKLAEINGIPAAAHLGRHVSEVVPGLIQTIAAVTQRILATGQPVLNHEFSGETQAAPGKVCFWNESWYPVFDGNRTIAGYGVIVEEITERKRAETSLRESELLLQLALESGNIGIHSWNPQSGELYWDNRIRSQWDIASDAPVNYAVFMQGVHPDDRARVQALVDQALDPNNDSHYYAEYRVIGLGNKVERWIAASGKVFFENGRAQRVVGTTLDITAHKLAMIALQQADRRKDEFLAMLGHELRNPLTPISNVTEILNSPALDGKTLKWAYGILHRNVDHIVKIVDDLLDVSRITQGVIQLNLERIELSELLKESSEPAQHLMMAKDQTFSLEIPPKPIYVAGDRVRLNQIFANLLNNAAKYTGQGGHIRLTVNLENLSALVLIADNGMGIEPDLQPFIFDLFTQGKRGLARSEGGLGIGLTLVKKLVELHSGAISAYSAGANQGSEFTVRLPLLTG